LRDVVLGVLHHDAVTVEGVALEVPFEHDGDARLEQLGGVALMADRHHDTLALDVERGGAARFTHGTGDDRALDAEPLGAQLLLLSDSLVRGAEVQRGVPEAAHDEEAQRGQHDDADDDQAPPVLTATGCALLGRLGLGYCHRESRSSAERSRASARFLFTIHAAYDASTANVALYPAMRYPTCVTASPSPGPCRFPSGPRPAARRSPARAPRPRSGPRAWPGGSAGSAATRAGGASKRCRASPSSTCSRGCGDAGTSPRRATMTSGAACATTPPTCARSAGRCTRRARRSNCAWPSR